MIAIINIRSSSDLQLLYAQAYGANANTQFSALARKFGCDVNDVKQNALKTVLEKMSLYDPRIGDFASYLYGHLHALLKQECLGPLKCAASFDDTSESGLLLNKEVHQIATQESDEGVEYNIYAIHDPELRNIFSLANNISGKSTAQIAISWKVSRRRVNQRIAKQIKRAKEIVESKKSC